MPTDTVDVEELVHNTEEIRWWGFELKATPGNLHVTVNIASQADADWVNNNTYSGEVELLPKSFNRVVTGIDGMIDDVTDELGLSGKVIERRIDTAEISTPGPVHNNISINHTAGWSESPGFRRSDPAKTTVEFDVPVPFVTVPKFDDVDVMEMIRDNLTQYPQLAVAVDVNTKAVLIDNGRSSFSAPIPIEAFVKPVEMYINADCDSVHSEFVSDLENAKTSAKEQYSNAVDKYEKVRQIANTVLSAAGTGQQINTTMPELQLSSRSTSNSTTSRNELLSQRGPDDVFITDGGRQILTSVDVPDERFDALFDVEEDDLLQGAPREAINVTDLREQVTGISFEGAREEDQQLDRDISDLERELDDMEGRCADQYKQQVNELDAIQNNIEDVLLSADTGKSKLQDVLSISRGVDPDTGKANVQCSNAFPDLNERLATLIIAVGLGDSPSPYDFVNGGQGLDELESELESVESDIESGNLQSTTDNLQSTTEDIASDLESGNVSGAVDTAAEADIITSDIQEQLEIVNDLRKDAQQLKEDINTEVPSSSPCLDQMDGKIDQVLGELKGIKLSLPSVEVEQSCVEVVPDDIQSDVESLEEDVRDFKLSDIGNLSDIESTASDVENEVRSRVDDSECRQQFLDKISDATSKLDAGTGGPQLDCGDISQSIKNEVQSLSTAVNRYTSKDQIARIPEDKERLLTEADDVINKAENIDDENPCKGEYLNTAKQARSNLLGTTARPESALPCDQRFESTGERLNEFEDEVVELQPPVELETVNGVIETGNEVSDKIERNVPADDPCRREMVNKTERLVNQVQSLTARIRVDVEEGEETDEPSARELLGQLSEDIGAINTEEVEEAQSRGESQLEQNSDEDNGGINLSRDSEPGDDDDDVLEQIT